MREPTVTNTANILGSSSEYVIMFELIADEDEEDPALIHALGREVAAELQSEGFTPRAPIYTGQKGGFLVEFVTVIQQVVDVVWNNHATIAEGIADISGLITIFGGILPLLKRLRQVHEQQVGKEESATRQIKITTEIDGAPLEIEVSDITKADAALKLALKYRSAYPALATQVTTKSGIKVQGKVPARKRRRRR